MGVGTGVNREDVDNTDVDRFEFNSKGELLDAIDFWINNQDAARELYGDINTWDTSGVTDMSYLFEDRYSFNSNINDWDTSNVTTMEGMFMVSPGKDLSIEVKDIEFNQPIGNWNTSNVTNMRIMFGVCDDNTTLGDKKRFFNQDLYWDTSKVTTMKSMFYQATEFNGNLNFNTQNVNDMSYMFRRARSFNKDLNFNTQNVTTMENMFCQATSFNQSIEDWDTSSLITTKSMFKQATNFNSLIFTELLHVNDMSYMFQEATSYNQGIDTNTNSLVDASFMFNKASNFNNIIAISTDNVKNMESMFDEAINFNHSSIIDWKNNVSNLENTKRMFVASKSFNQNITDWVTPKLTPEKSVSMFAVFRPGNNWVDAYQYDDQNGNTNVYSVDGPPSYWSPRVDTRPDSPTVIGA